LDLLRVVLAKPLNSAPNLSSLSTILPIEQPIPCVATCSALPRFSRSITVVPPLDQVQRHATADMAEANATIALGEPRSRHPGRGPTTMSPVPARHEPGPSRPPLPHCRAPLPYTGATPLQISARRQAGTVEVCFKNLISSTGAIH
jgi:hypothetical protein